MEKTEMKRTFLKVLPFAAALLLATSCSKDDNNSTDEIVNGGEQIETVTKTVKTLTIKGKVKQSISKVTTNSGGTALAFEGNEKFTFGQEGDDVYGTITILEANGNYEATVNYTDDEALFSTTGFTAIHGENPSKISEGYSTLAAAVQHACYETVFTISYDNANEKYSLASAGNSDIVINLKSAFIKALSAESTTLGGEPIDVEADKYYVVPEGKTMGETSTTTLAGQIYNLGTKVFAFSVSSTEKVAFSSGNLQKVGSQYQFAASQTEYVGAGSGEKIDLFQWADDFYTYISGWRVLTDAEWKYLIGDGDSKRDNATNLRKWTKIGDVNGLVILPDECTASISDDWATLEAAGAVFLPANDAFYGDSGYWSSSPRGLVNAWCLDFGSDGDVDVSHFYRGDLLAVRLVRSL